MDPAEIGRNRQRFIGTLRGIDPGPTFVCVAAVHGDEPAGVLALDRVFRAIEERKPRIKGDVVGIAGNLGALVEGRRYVATDLNRYWLDEHLERVRNGASSELTHEDRELRELLDTLDSVFERARGEVYLIDLHTSSAAGDPFVCVGDTLRNRAFAERFGVPVIRGLEECIDGSLLEHVNNLGHVTMGVEAGKHTLESSVDNLEAFVWLALVNTAMLRAVDVPEIEGAR